MRLRLILACALAAVTVLQITQSTAKKMPAPPPFQPLTLHGSTPSMAWSADGSRVVINSAFDYYGFDQTYEKHKDQLGIYVVDARTGEKTRIYTDQGYHPLWLEDDLLAWGHSPYEDGQEGLFIASIVDKSPNIEIHERSSGVYHTQPLKDGGVLYYNGFRGSRGWMRFDPTTRESEPFQLSDPPAVKWGASWHKATDDIIDQCPQEVGDVRVGATSSGAMRIYTGAADHDIGVQLYTYNVTCGELGGCGPVLPCLSPQGDRVAYLTHADTIVGYTLHIHSVSDLIAGRQPKPQKTPAKNTTKGASGETPKPGAGETRSTR